MLILITKDGATVVPKEVASLDEAKQYADNGFHVDVETEDGRKQLSDLLAAADGQVQTLPDGAGNPEPTSVADHVPEKPQGIVEKVKAAVTRKKR